VQRREGEKHTEQDEGKERRSRTAHAIAHRQTASRNIARQVDRPRSDDIPGGNPAARNRSLVFRRDRGSARIFSSRKGTFRPRYVGNARFLYVAPPRSRTKLRD